MNAIGQNAYTDGEDLPDVSSDATGAIDIIQKLAALIICTNESGRSASTICVITPACACAARTGRLRPGPLSTATKLSRQLCRDRSLRTITSERRSKV
jgi:hypothetical protein